MNKYIFFSGLAVLSASLLLGLTSCHSDAQPAPPATLVEAITLEAKAWHDNTETTATVLALQGALLKSEVSGRITQVAFKPGTHVEKGALLFEINPVELRAKLHMSQALADLESANYQRALQLYAKHVISRADYDRAKSSALNNKATVDAAQAALDQAVVHAPFAGTTGLDLVKEGDYVTIGQSLVSLQQLERLRVDFSVPEQFSNQLHVGDLVVVKPRDNSQHSYQGVVSAVDNAIDPSTRLLAVRATINNSTERLLPGAFVDVTIYYGPSSSIVSVPQVAVVSGGSGDKVYRIIKGKAVATNFTLGTRIDDQVIIKRGLNAGDVVITSGQLKLEDGALVAIKPDKVDLHG